MKANKYFLTADALTNAFKRKWNGNFTSNFDDPIRTDSNDPENSMRGFVHDLLCVVCADLIPNPNTSGIEAVALGIDPYDCYNTVTNGVNAAVENAVASKPDSVSDEDARTIANDALAHLTGKILDEVIGDDWQDVLDKLDAAYAKKRKLDDEFVAKQKND